MRKLQFEEREYQSNLAGIDHFRGMQASTKICAKGLAIEKNKLDKKNARCVCIASNQGRKHIQQTETRVNMLR